MKKDKKKNLYFAIIDIYKFYEGQTDSHTYIHTDMATL